MALGDRLKALWKVLDLLKGLNIDKTELIALTKMAFALFKAWSVEGVFEFAMAVLAAMESGPAVAVAAGRSMAASSGEIEVVEALHDVLEAA